MSEALLNSEILKQLRRENTTDIDALVHWLQQPSQYTTFRLNTLRKEFKIDVLREELQMHCEELGASQLPHCYFLRPDCIVVQQWPRDVVVEETDKEIIVDALCGAAVLRGAHVYTPGVMGMPSNIQLGDMVNVFADVEGSCKRGLKIPFIGKKRLVGKGRIKQLRLQIFGENAPDCGIAVHIVMPSSRLPVINESISSVGDILLQNLPSIVCGWVLDAKPYESILDMCAAPGNKTTHMAEMSDNLANIIAIDKTISKVAKIKQNCINHGVTCVQSYVFDSTKGLSELATGVKDGPPFPGECFDKILLDAPCSGLGQRPQLLNKMSLKVFLSYQFLQRKLFATAVQLLKAGGRLVYSTCTVSQNENEDIVAWALGKFPSMELVAAEPLLGGPGWPNCGLTDQQRKLVQRFGPEHDALRPVDDIYRDTIGFFIACFKKNLN